jgi:WD40 repeat protein
VIERYNLQSGEFRGYYGRSESNTRHEVAVVGIAIDALLKTVVSVDFSGKMKFWKFRTQKLLGELDLGCPVTQMEFFEENDLAAVVTDQLEVILVDTALTSEEKVGKVVRRLHGHSGRITDLVAFSLNLFCAFAILWAVISCDTNSTRICSTIHKFQLFSFV